jgi:hypothetical protein
MTGFPLPFADGRLADRIARRRSIQCHTQRPAPVGFFVPHATVAAAGARRHVNSRFMGRVAEPPVDLTHQKNAESCFSLSAPKDDPS